MYRHTTTSSTCVANHYDTTPSHSPLFSGSAGVQELHCEHVLRYGGGGQHMFSTLDIEP